MWRLSRRKWTTGSAPSPISWKLLRWPYKSSASGCTLRCVDTVAHRLEVQRSCLRYLVHEPIIHYVINCKIFEIQDILFPVIFSQNIFIGEDIRKQLPKESANFDGVNENWKVSRMYWSWKGDTSETISATPSHFIVSPLQAKSWINKQSQTLKTFLYERKKHMWLSSIELKYFFVAYFEHRYTYMYEALWAPPLVEA